MLGRTQRSDHGVEARGNAERKTCGCEAHSLLRNLAAGSGDGLCWSCPPGPCFFGARPGRRRAGAEYLHSERSLKGIGRQ